MLADRTIQSANQELNLLLEHVAYLAALGQRGKSVCFARYDFERIIVLFNTIMSIGNAQLNEFDCLFVAAQQKQWNFSHSPLCSLLVGPHGRAVLPVST